MKIPKIEEDASSKKEVDFRNLFGLRKVDNTVKDHLLVHVTCFFENEKKYHKGPYIKYVGGWAGGICRGHEKC